MILTDRELDKIRQELESHSGFDEELLRRCGHLMHMDAFDEAVRSAFVLLEERITSIAGKEGMTGTQLANYAFNPQGGPLSKHLAKNTSEREGLRELYSGAFKLFRNPSAHSAVGYDSVDGKAIISMVNMMLRMIKRLEELPPPGFFPEYLETALQKMEGSIGPGAMGRLRIFLNRCIDLGFKPRKGKVKIPLKQYALYQAGTWDEPRPYRIPVFYLVEDGNNHKISFPIGYYRNVAGFDAEKLVEDLRDIGFQPEGKLQRPACDLKISNDQSFFDSLYLVMEWIQAELEESL